MATKIEFKSLNETELAKSAGKSKSFKGDQPKAAVSPAILKARMKTWQNSQHAPVEKIKLEKITAVRLRATDVAKLRAINESITPTAEALVGQKLAPEKTLGTLVSSFITLEYTKMQSEYKTRLAAATTPAAKTEVQNQWKEGVKAFQQSFADNGVTGIKETDLNKFSQELVKNKTNFNAIVKIANTGVFIADVATQDVLKGGFVPVTGVLIDSHPATTSIPGLCSVPFKQGSFTRHFSKSFSLTVRIPYICFPHHWYRPEWCHKSVTLAGASFSVDVNVNYRVTCCGATASGQAGAQACVTLIGFRFCAGCTATITGVAGIGRTSSSGGNCIYGIGINAQLKCTFGGFTVLNLQAPFGFNVSGPCPPLGICG